MKWVVSETGVRFFYLPCGFFLLDCLNAAATNAILFVCRPAPSSCVVTEWAEWDPCSVTCGLGMRRRERMVKMPPIDGSLCRAEVAEVEKCMMPECRESPSNLTSHVTPWNQRQE